MTCTVLKMSERELNFLVEPSEEYHCPICAKVLVEPHVTECCGQHFCEQCLKKWFEEQGKMICPHCRSEHFSHIRYLPLKRKINELLVYCSNRDKGCTEITCVCQLESHISQCTYTAVKCSNNCGDSPLRKDLSDHLNDRCLNRLSVCIYCQKQDKHYIIVSLQHQQRCPDFPVGCPKSCSGGDQVKRKKLYEHSLICPLESVVCSDCQAEMLRQQITEHKGMTCPKRIVSCLFCQEQIRYDVTDAHFQECPIYPVECPRHCEFGRTLLRKDLDFHRENCPLEPVVCSACKIEVIRKEMNEHSLSECPKRSTKCKYCHRIGPYDDITGQHVNECEEFPVGCPRKCKGSEQLKRKNMRNHAEVCPLEPVQCPYSEVGCKPHLVRKDLNSHLKSNLDSHMLKLMTAHTQLIAEHDKLQNDHTKLKSDFGKLNRECGKLRTDLVDTQAKHSEVAENFTKMTSSISLEMDFIGKGKDNDTSLQCIKTALNPKMKDSKARLAFRVPPITHRWTSPSFYVLDGYKMSLVFSKDEQQRSTVGFGWGRSATLPLNTVSSTTSVSLQLLKGEYDARLKWPTDSALTLEIRVTSKTSASSRQSATARQRPQRNAYRHDSGWKKYEPHHAYRISTYSGGLKRDDVCVSYDGHHDYGYDDQNDYDDYLDDRDANADFLQLSLKLNQYLQQKVTRENTRELKRGSIESKGPWTVKLSLSEPKTVPKAVLWDQGDYFEHHNQYYDDD